ncbi:myogenesis-regulating glycosidase [Trichonephila clavata]|uniref:Myogenesis-regulating glycosidase n=1 Tax=Trichonephila clavata TaxID=2740835 RepID=A0A8X6F9X6_TRICU|nr:myogenesis-regulating glycosidase [Trichonephila clavata]
MLWVILAILILIAPEQGSSQNLHNSKEDPDTFGVPTLVLGSLHLTLSSKLLLDIQSPRSQTLKGYLGWLPKKSNMNYTSCTGEDSTSESICLKYGKDMKLLITPDNEDNCNEEEMVCDAIECHKILWINHIGGAMDCFILGEDDWYGSSERWPIQEETRNWYPAVTGDPLHHPSGNVVENLWLSSSGFLIYVDREVPLFVSFNESGSGTLCFSTSSKKHPYEIEELEQHILTYSICSATTIKEAYMYSMHKWVQKPIDIPNESMFQYPIWSTWARYKRNINETVILRFAEEIRTMGFPTNQLEIDDKWETCYGDLRFDLDKFPDPGGMVRELRNEGFAVTLWVHPFCNTECEMYKIGEEKGFWVEDEEGDPLEVKWWNGDTAAVLDTTNEMAVEWFVERLKALQSEYGIVSFKFDAGEVLWMDKNFELHHPEANLQPNIYSSAYAELAAKFGGRVEVRVGYDSQHLPIFIRMFDKFSSWDYPNGLKTLIPNALQLSLMGYFYILPDMIGGNNYGSVDGSLPDRELYIRWLQATVFLPVLQFSIAPWDYDDEVIAIAKKMVDLHEKYANHMLKAAMDATNSGKPIIRPLWWIAPDDTEALRSDSQFLVGDDILVAPVIAKGKKKRNIYLPEGKWTDAQRRITHEGPQWLFNYDAPLNFLPYFIRHS